jgi:nicotinamide riboside kinase
MTEAPLRIVVIGPECTGKTTLAREVAESLGVPVVPEAARLYAEWHDGALSAATVAPIAQLSIRLEEEALAAIAGAPRALIVRDTDLVSTVVYSRHYYGHVEPWIEGEARARLGDLYLLCATDIPWVPDGVRDRPAARDDLHRDFSEELERLGARVAHVSGRGAARLASALDAIRSSGISAMRGASS